MFIRYCTCTYSCALQDKNCDWKQTFAKNCENVKRNTNPNLDFNAHKNRIVKFSLLLAYHVFPASFVEYTGLWNNSIASYLPINRSADGCCSPDNIQEPQPQYTTQTDNDWYHTYLHSSWVHLFYELDFQTVQRIF